MSGWRAEPYPLPHPGVTTCMYFGFSDLGKVYKFVNRLLFSTYLNRGQFGLGCVCYTNGCLCGGTVACVVETAGLLQRQPS
jgi:hypothetical protein